MKSYDTALKRLVLILTKLSNDDRPTLNELCEEFNVGLRTIQRDIYERLIYFPIEKDTSGQLKFIEGFTLNRSALDNEEMLLLYLSMSHVKSISSHFESKIDNIFSKLLHPNFTSPYFIKTKSSEKIDIKSSLIKKIEEAIKNQIISEVAQSNLIVVIKPYKITNIDGIWYLFARDMKDEKVKTYLLSNIENFKLTKKTFELKTDVDDVLSNVHSAWFEDGNKFDVVVNVKANIAQYFKLKKFIPTQEILHENTNGSLIVKFEVSHLEDIDNILKAWLPDIEVIEPVEYKEKIYNELSGYLKIN